MQKGGKKGHVLKLLDMPNALTAIPYDYQV